MRRTLCVALLAALALPVAGARAAVLPQDDAGSGTDAPDTPTASFVIHSGAVYSGTVEGKTTGDSDDWYAFTAPAGAVIEARVASPVGCLSVDDAAGTELTSACSAGFAETLGRATAVAPTAGTYYLRYNYTNPNAGDTEPHAYRFSLGVGRPAPAPLPVGTDFLFGYQHRLPPVAPATESGDHVVVAVVDSGVNLYHDFFAAPALTDHPSTWLPGFPASATTVADETGIDGIQRSTYDPENDTYDAHLYTFPGTRVVGGISFGEYAGATDVDVTTARPVLDDLGHGTHSAGLAGGAGLAAADGDVLLVAVEVGNGRFEEGIRWAAREPWIDAITVSLGTLANAPATFSPVGNRTGPEWATREAHLSGKPVFVASGNGFSDTGDPPDHCTTYTSPYAGPAWVTRIGAASPDDDNPTWWHCVPVEAIARTNVGAPAFDSQDAVTEASGTSAATPNAAGAYAHLLLAARRAGSTATRLETLDYLLHAAAPPPLAAGNNDPSAYPLSLADQGYGLVDQQALDAARTRLLANSGPRPRPETEAWFAHDAAIRTALWGPGSATDGSETPPQDDAGTGTDAPDGPSNRVHVEPGVRYDGLLTGSVGDSDDWYAFDGTTGEAVSAIVAGATACVDVVRPSGTVLASQCAAGYASSVPATGTLDETGTWHLVVHEYVPQPYSFGFGLNGPAPVVFP